MSRPPEKQRAWASINLGALERNLRAIRQALPEHLRFISVVKANAYGHGLAPVVTRLMRAEADAFGVANLDEAMQLQEVGIGWPILVLSVMLPSEYEEAIRLGVRPVVSSAREVQALDKAASSQNRKTGIHLKVDTGMGRLGVWHEEFQSVIQSIQDASHIELEGLCTHFSSADTDPDFTYLQRKRFLGVIAQVPPDWMGKLMIHADNSAGMESFPAKGPFNAARVGLMQFGVRPSPGSLLNSALIEPVLSFHTRVGLVKNLPSGTPVSYGQTHKLSRDSRIAILTAGYADGLSTGISNRGKVIIGDSLCPIIGRVTMDQTIVDVTDAPTCPEVGTTATFIGRSESFEVTATQYAEWSNQVEWEALCSISNRTQRVYRTDTAV